MKKTIKIHISGFIFTLDDDAYENLNKWIQNINRQYSQEEGGNEIVEDIEFRVAELLQERALGEDKIITVRDVNEVIQIMGMPEDFDDETAQKQEPKVNFDKKSQKHLYRDIDNNVVAGVCGGVGAYFSIDPVIIRILFIIAVLFGGSGTIIYIILWIITPEAKTASQKLEMKGEKVNVSNIEKTIKEEFESIKKNIVRRAKSENFNNISVLVQNLAELLINILKVIFKITGYFIAAIFIILGLTVIASLLGILVFNLSPDVFSSSEGISDIGLVSKIIPVDISGFWISMGLFLTIGIPFVAIIYAGIKIIFKIKGGNRIIGATGITLWIIGIIITSGIAMKIASGYKTENIHSKSYILTNPKSDNLYLDLMKNIDKEYLDAEFHAADFRIFYDNKSPKTFGSAQFNIKKSNNDDIKLKIDYKSRGKSKNEVLENIKNINYSWVQNDSLVEFSPYFSLIKSQKIHGQSIDITLYLPEGKTVFLANDMSKIIYDIENVQNMWDKNMTGQYWTMTKDGLSNKNTQTVN